MIRIVDPARVAVDTDALIERCLDRRSGRRGSEIVRQHWRKVFNLAYKFVGRHDEAEDLTQDIFLKIFKALHTFDRRANFQTWLISISRNLCIDHYRSVRKERETMARDVDASELMPVSREREPARRARADRPAASASAQALAELPPTLREAVVLRDLQEFSYQEIADKLRPAGRHREVAHQPRPTRAGPAAPSSSSSAAGRPGRRRPEEPNERHDLARRRRGGPARPGAAPDLPDPVGLRDGGDEPHRQPARSGSSSTCRPSATWTARRSAV